MYDKKKIAIDLLEGKIEIKLLEAKKRLYVIRTREVEVEITSELTLNDLLRISNNHDVFLIITTDNSKSELIINDNGHDFINIDKSQFDVKEIKVKLNQIIKC